MTEGIRPSAAPGRGESSSEGACLVDHPAVNEGELARGLTRDVGVVGVGCWTVAVTVSPESLHLELYFGHLKKSLLVPSNGWCWCRWPCCTRA